MSSRESANPIISYPLSLCENLHQRYVCGENPEYSPDYGHEPYPGLLRHTQLVTEALQVAGTGENELHQCAAEGPR